MKASDDMKGLTGIIFDLLSNYPKYRDNDKMLACRVWSIQMEEKTFFSKEITAYKFFDLYSNGDFLSSQDNISRIARMIKTDNPHLEGTKAGRLPECEKVKEVVK